jgi:signal transduction histidine kinase
MPIRARIALFGAAVVALTVLIFGILVYVLLERNLDSLQDKELASSGQELVRRLQFGRSPLDLSLGLQRSQLPVDLRSSTDTYREVLDAAGTPLISTGELSGNAPVVPASVLQVARTRVVRTNIDLEGGVRVRVFVSSWTRGRVGGFVVVGQSTQAIDRQLGGLRTTLLVGALLSLLAASAASWLVAGRALRPLETMALTAEEIGRTQDLTRRLPALGSRDEVARLRTSFNGMLQQLQDAYQRLEGALAAQHRFVADASHELRTPLTTIRSNVGLLLKRDDLRPEDRLAALQDVASESDRMSRLVRDLLTLARADAGQHLDKEALDLRPLLQDVFRQAQQLHPDRRLHLTNGVPATVVGNGDALTQLLWILVDNATKHTAVGGQIDLTLAREGEEAVVTVRDDGPGIPPSELERIFERFYQTDLARSGGGAGLGLSIARWIVDEHQGSLTAVNNAGAGVTFRICLPAASS